MTKDLSLFFPEQVAKREVGFTKIASRRFKDEEGNIIKWEFSYPTHEDFKKIKKAASKQIVEGNKIKYDYDQDAMFMEGIISTITFPNLKDAALQDAYNAYTPKELLENMLYPDELEKLGREVAIEIGAAENPFDLLDEAKN